MSVLAAERLAGRVRAGIPPPGVTPPGALGQPCERRQEEEVLHGENGAADHAGERAGQAQVRLPQAAETRAPQARAMTLRGNANELRERVVHVKHLVVEDVVEDSARG